MTPRHGPVLIEGGVHYRLWAPAVAAPSVRVAGADHPLEPSGDGWWEARVAGPRPGDCYCFVLPDGHTLPDPAGRRMPDGVHGASQLWDPTGYAWRYTNPSTQRERLIFYELHIGTFTAEGTLDAAASHLADLAALGITCIELLPVQPFSGARNWGYDGVAIHAVHEAYGGPEALQRFVDVAHGVGLAVCLDLVFNHLGPEGNYLARFGPYFSNRRPTPWGAGMNFDGDGSRAVRRLLLQAALQWIGDFRVDALRLDAVHAMVDDGPRHFVRELTDAVNTFARAHGRQVHVIAEGINAEDGEVIAPAGWGCAALWVDDFHDAVRALLTGERHGTLAPFGEMSMLAETLARGIGPREKLTDLWRRPRGTGLGEASPSRFVSYLQNHDQVANHPGSLRLAALLPREAQGALAVLLALGPGLPLLFMGEEYGEDRPFYYFTSHGDPVLAAKVRAGRLIEHPPRPGQDNPDPQEERTFQESVLTHRRDGPHGTLWRHYRDLLAVRARHAEMLGAIWPAVRVEGSCLTLSRPGLTVSVNLGSVPCGGLRGWGFRVDEVDQTGASVENCCAP